MKVFLTQTVSLGYHIENDDVSPTFLWGIHRRFEKTRVVNQCRGDGFAVEEHLMVFFLLLRYVVDVHKQLNIVKACAIE